LGGPNGIGTPKAAIDAFLTIYSQEIELLHQDYQASIGRKNKVFAYRLNLSNFIPSFCSINPSRAGVISYKYEKPSQ